MKKTTLRITVVLAALVLLVSCFAGCGSDEEDNKPYRDYKEIKASGNITIGVSADNNPIAFATETGEYQGYEIYFAKRLAEELGLDVQFVETEAESRVKYLESGKVDVVIASYEVEKNAKRFVDFTLPYMKSSLAAVTPNGKKLESLDDLGKKDGIIVISGSPAETYMKENYPDANLVEFSDENDAVDALLRNLGVVWVGGNTQVASFAQQNRGYSVTIPELGKVSKIAPAVAKGNSKLVKKLDKIIEKLTDDGFFREAYDATLIDDFGTEIEDSFIIEN